MKSKSSSKQPVVRIPKTTLAVRDPESLRWQMQQVQLAIARRAYELFEARAQEHGHDWEDWFQAESELLRPVSVSMSETNEQISVRANVLGFEQDELSVGIEPRRLTILGRMEISAAGTEGSKLQNTGPYPDQILSLIDLQTDIRPDTSLQTDIRPDTSVIESEAGLLKFELRKAAKLKAAPPEIRSLAVMDARQT